MNILEIGGNELNKKFLRMKFHFFYFGGKFDHTAKFAHSKIITWLGPTALRGEAWLDFTLKERRRQSNPSCDLQPLSFRHQ